MAARVVILAGGEGRRMGGDKPGRAYGATTLLGRAVELAWTWSSDVAVAVRAPAQAPAGLGIELLLDRTDLEGPIAGLAAALADARDRRHGLLLTLPCDAPHLPSDLFERLQESLRSDQLCAVAVSGGRRHPTCALWRPHALDVLAGYLATGRRSLNGFADACAAAEVAWPVDPADPFANANTPQELARLQPRAA
ncbi:MAG: NTP transferase domain-containing protein [Phenylobacterium sp.]|uniref:molybdenum cofactor guanylyltransferase n=1 Tax=Phenylobacterium sp. TaxID=1871053 RepID=UPI0025D743BE|nr:molybdenum cofactor guanylyltransferase [Phenylobacterium sp.]MBI1197931.1 NTP transferase domain-containing protein [Phenylobacterium sp.]